MDRGGKVPAIGISSRKDDLGETSGEARRHYHTKLPLHLRSSEFFRDVGGPHVVAAPQEDRVICGMFTFVTMGGDK